MRAAPSPGLHVFVCANRREGSPLGPGCGAHGDAVYDALKREVGARGEVTRTWITKTHCLGICPKHGATVARHPLGADPTGAALLPRILTEVTVGDVASLLADAPLFEEPAAPEAVLAPPPLAIDELVRELDEVEALQRKKVLDLARRLKPGLTLEDVQNPHDFPELDDPDWHYADGVLTGITSVKMTVAALVRSKKVD